MWVRYGTGTSSLTHDSHKQVTEREIWVSHGSMKVTVFWDMTLCSARATPLTVARLHGHIPQHTAILANISFLFPSISSLCIEISDPNTT